MIFFRNLAVTLLTVLLVGCGGGSSDGGGSSGGVIFTATGTFSAGSVSGPVTLTITVSGNTVTVTDGSDSGSGKLNANGTSFIVPIAVSGEGLSCSAFNVNGEISGMTVSGTFSGNAKCTLSGGPIVTIPTSGSFSGTQTGTTAKSRNSSSFSNSMNAAIN